MFTLNFPFFQNKNNNLVLALLRLVHLKKFNRIELAYMVPGHSYLPCDRRFAHIIKHVNGKKLVGSPDHLKELINQCTYRKYNVEKLTREDIKNIDVLVSKCPKERVALIRTSHGKKFQTASCIVLRISCRDGYILKDTLETGDTEGFFIDCKLPNTKDNSFDLSTVELVCKYDSQIKLAPEKLADLRSMGSDLGAGGAWIDQLIRDQQEIAAEYPQDELITSFPDETHDYDMNFGYEKPRRMDPDEGNEDMVDDDSAN